MNHTFDVDLATEYGIDAAVIISNFAFWINHNRANEVNFREGRFWTFSSYAALCRIFPYLSKDQIYRRIQKMIESGILLLGHFPDDFLGRTNWYSFSDSFVEKHPEFKFCVTPPSDFAESRNASGEIATPYRGIAKCSIYKDNKQDITRARVREDDPGPTLPTDRTRQTPQYNLFVKHFGAEDAAALQPFSREQLSLCADLELLDAVLLLWKTNGWQHLNVGSIIQRYRDDASRKADKTAGPAQVHIFRPVTREKDERRREIQPDPMFYGLGTDETKASA